MHCAVSFERGQSMCVWHRTRRKPVHAIGDGLNVLGRGAAAAADEVDEACGGEFFEKARSDFGGFIEPCVAHRVGQACVWIEEADFVLVVLSENAIQSQWVKIEWQTKFWLEVSTTNTIVIPILIESCEIPALLKTKKYINFQNNYSEGLSELAYSIGKLMEKQHTISK
jgi:hypothetical protein